MSPGPDSPRPRRSRPPGGLRRLAALRGQAALRAFVRDAGDRRLERTVGSALGLRLLFTALASSFTPERADGVTGELCCELRTAGGKRGRWTLVLGPDGARARAGAAEDPRLTVRLTVADLVRIAGGELDPGAALLSGRMDLEGDVALALRLGELFGPPPPAAAAIRR